MEILVDNHVDSHELAAVYILSNAMYSVDVEEAPSALPLDVIWNPVLDDQLLSVTIVDASVKYGLCISL